MNSYLKLLFIAFAVFFSWEYTALSYDHGYKPSDTLYSIAGMCQDIWEFVGYVCAKLSSFFTWVKFKRVLTVLHNMFEPLIKIFTSIFYFFKGYVDTAKLYEHPYLVGLGSIVLIGVLFWVLVKFRLK